MIQIKNLNKTYDRRRVGENHVLHDISLTLPDTGFVCILGPSGCGKTSLLNAIGGLDDFDNGTITVGDVSVSRYGTALYEAERNRSFGYIFQNYYLLPEHSVGYNVYLGLHSQKLTHLQKIRRVKEALKAVEMDRYIRRNVGELSGGQQQRVAIARALARKPRVIFADEPTGNLDEANTLKICTLLRGISKTSLVVMVTHEERIAEFFADRIISLDSGRLTQDSADWERSGLSIGGGKALYTGDYPETRLDADKVSLRLFQAEGIEPVSISVVALKDRIIIKLDDRRAVSCGTSQDAPMLLEGKRPVLTLEEVDRQEPEQSVLPEEAPAENTTSGSSLSFTDMLREARHITRGAKLRGFGTRLFLLLLSVLLTISVADFISLATIRPEDFVTTHSQALEVQVTRGPRAGSSTDSLQDNAQRYKAYISTSELDFLCVPDVSYTATVSGSPILQANKITVPLRNLNYAPMAWLEESSLILGVMPQDPTQIVVDKWVLEAVMAEEGVAQNSIPGMEYFLGKQVKFGMLKAAPTIVGICDSGEPAIYLSDEMFACVGTSGTEVMALSTFQAMYPGQFDDVVLEDDECIVLPANAGEIFRDMLGSEFKTSSGCFYNIVALSDLTDCYAKAIVADSQIQVLMQKMSARKFWIYCQDKEAVTEYLTKTARRVGDAIEVSVTDLYAEKVAEYEEASRLQADARSIVILTVILLSAVMLYLLRRADVQGRIGMLSVYRLLGIPSSKAVGIFCIESMLSSLTTVVPAVAAVWAVIEVLATKDATELVLPWYAACLVILGILCFQLLVTVLPLRSLLKLPPARLAAKYDF